MLNILFVCAFLWQYYNNVKNKYVKYPDGDLNPKINLELRKERRKRLYKIEENKYMKEHILFLLIF